MKRLVLPLLFLPSVALAQPRFYLSTDRVFAPGETAEIKLEAKEVERLQMRLYRIADPAAYFDGQADLHRPKEALGTPQRSSLGMLRRGAKRGLLRMLNEARGKFGQTARDAIKGAVPRLHDAALAGAVYENVPRVVPLLEDHELLDLWEHDIQSSGAWSYGTVALPVTKPGAYLVEAVAKDQVAHTVVLITDVALVTKQSSSKLLVWAVDPASGDPRSGTDVTVKVRGETKGEQKTDASGLARFDLGLASTPVVYGKNGKSFTLLDPRFYPANLSVPKVYVYTERPVYRPGQTVYVKGFARSMKDEAYTLMSEGHAGRARGRRSARGQLDEAGREALRARRLHQRVRAAAGAGVRNVDRLRGGRRSPAQGRVQDPGVHQAGGSARGAPRPDSGAER